ncbi:unnamed protein product [Durusdinium trenchii]|uniref:Uncharacterized protein n=2 Tax=Durusdinium trenchii TaxID=1381693 RepID=A0ABP0HCR4_9DINO
MSSLLAKIATPVLQLGSALGVGFVAFRCEWVTEKQGLAFLTGRIGLPLLAFKAVATADLDDVEFLAVLSCFIGKAFVYLLACAVTWVACHKKPRSDALVSMAIFSFHVTAANDFVFGIPIMQAFYPKDGMTNLVANVVVQNVIFQVCSLSMLGVGTAQAAAQLADGSAATLQGTSATGSGQASRIVKQLAQDPLLCAIVLAVLYSFLATVCAPHLDGAERLPWIVGEMIDFFTRPFSVTALLLTGANLATALGQKSQQSDLGSMYFVSIPICLVVAKNFLCPYVSLAASELLLPGSSNNRWHSFAFLYGLIPTSSAPMLVAMRVGKHIEVVAAAVSVGILVAFPMLIAAAVLLGTDTVDEGLVDKQLRISDLVALCLSLGCLLVCIPCFRLQERDSEWRKFPNRMLVWYVGACIFHSICGLLLDSWFPTCSAIGEFVSNYCEVQRYVLVCLMLHWLRRFESGLRADKTLWIALIAPLPICIWAPQPLTKKNCILDGGEANKFDVIVGLVFLVLLASLTLAGLCRKGEAETLTASRSTETPEQPSFVSFHLGSANNLVEFEPDSPTCYQHLGTSRIEQSPARQSRQSRLSSEPRSPLSLPLESRNLEMRELPTAALQDQFLQRGDSQRRGLANLKFAILVIAAKCTIVLAISTIIRSILSLQSFHTETESALVFGLMVQLLLENTEGCFILLLVLSFFDTYWSRLARELRHRHRRARSRAPSLEPT